MEVFSLKKRVLIVDDSAFMRRIIRQMIESDPFFEVIGTARDGQEGVELTLELKPDVITMDVEMPRMNGLEATDVIMTKLPTPILIVSSLTSEGAEATLEALEKGAIDYLAKNLVSSALDVMNIRDELIEKLKVVVRSKGSLKRRSATSRKTSSVISSSPAVTISGRKTFATQKMAIVAIGASTGGPKAVQDVLSKLPGGLATAFIVSIHMPAAFTGAFAQRLNSLSELTVREAVNGDKLEHGVVLVSPGGRQTRVKRRGVTNFTIEISDDPPDSLYKPAIDIMMSSVAEAYPGRSMGVILTGMGHDGLEGMTFIRKKGGKTLVQNEETCTVYGMPKAVIEAKIADKIAPLDHIAGEIVNMI